MALALGQGLVLPLPESLAPFPRRAQRRLDVPQMRIDALDFVRFHRCDMGALIGARNSAQARLADAVTRLEYEGRWLRQARSCAADVQDVEWLLPYIEAKQAAYGAVIYNALFDHRGMTAVMGNTRLAADGERATTLRRGLQAWGDLTDARLALGDAGSAAQVAALGSALRDLEASFRLGARRQEWRQIREALTTIVRGLEQRKSRLCLSGQPTPRVRRLIQVFRNYYLPWQADFAPRLNVDGRWQESWQLLLGSLQIPTVVQTWAQTIGPTGDGEWARTSAALRAHARAWEELLNGCGMQVTDLAAA
ncbi:MAG: DUF3080 family protein [Pseudomonadota bacterium]